jgi:hypothetical protein
MSAAMEAVDSVLIQAGEDVVDVVVVVLVVVVVAADAVVVPDVPVVAESMLKEGGAKSGAGDVAGVVTAGAAKVVDWLIASKKEAFAPLEPPSNPAFV